MALLIPINSRVDWPLATRGVSKTGPEPRTKKQIHMSLVYVSPMKQNNICNGGICLYIYTYVILQVAISSYHIITIAYIIKK